MVLVCALAVLGAAHAADPVKVSVVTDRADAIYKCAETAKFAVKVEAPAGATMPTEFRYILSNDGVAQIAQGTGTLTAGAAEVTGTLAEPGILRCTVYVSDAGKSVYAMAGAAFDPERIQPTATEPADFGTFWQHNLEKLSRVPMDVKLTPNPQASNDKIAVYKISLANILGTRVYGWVAMPKSGGPFPAILQIPGAGVGPASAGSVTGRAARGFISMFISVHNYDVDLPAEKFAELNTGELAGYRTAGRTHRNSYYYLRVILGCARAVDYLRSREDWDGKTMIVTGSSQGGALTLITGGLCHDKVTAIGANVPAMCDHTGRYHGRPSGWPQLIPMGDPYREKIVAEEVAPYYDAVNFARHITCPAKLGVGLIDNTCPATTVFSAYNVLNVPKQIVISPLMGHAISKEYTDLTNEWFGRLAFGPPMTMELTGGISANPKAK
jgi:cephalosporin-C deacetylase